MKSFAFLALATLVSARAGVVWDESSNGALSNDRLAPTAVTVKAGVNTIKGSLGNPYYDYIKFSVPKGYGLVGLELEALSSQNSGATIFGIAKGTTFPSTPSGLNANLMLGWAGVNPTSVGADLIDILALANHGGYGNSGFTVPLAAGDYTLWVQDYDTPVTYQYSLLIEAAVPPAIKVLKTKVQSRKATLTVSANGKGTELRFRVGKKGAFKTVHTKTSTWTVVASRLKPGSNTIFLQAKGLFGTSTKKVTVVVK